MDDAVARALEKWPDVPACVGWLALDKRGRWRIRDESAQRHGLLGDVVRNPTLKAFIDRNYDRDAAGAWFFQNGPQRVYVNLEGGPFVFFIEGEPPRISTHTGLVVEAVRAAYIDGSGQFWLESDFGAGLVCDRDLPALVERLRLADGTIPDPDRLLELAATTPGALRLALPQMAGSDRLVALRSADAPDRFRFIARPSLTVGNAPVQASRDG